jgi:CheY-like chemotaxis protein
MVIGPVGLAAIVGSALQMTRGLLDQHRISVVNKCAEEVVVLADTTRLRQILVNLLSNAAKYNREGGSVRIDCQPREADLMRVSVTDTGPGIAPEHLPNLFKPFERLGAETTAVEGAGIGLALSQKLAELMGTTLGVATSLGQGSTFWLDIPRAEAATVSAAAAEALASVGQSRTRVLYVEDNPANLKVVEAMFRHHPDLLLFSAVSGEAGLELARRYLPDVILLDIHLPGMDGYAVLQALQEDPDTRAIPVIALSADAMPIDVERGLAAGFREYLTKPIQLRELMLAVDKALKEAKS